MKIAVIGAKGLPAKQGGIEHHCEELYYRMVQKGHSVDLFARSSYTGSSVLHTYTIDGVQVISLPCLNVKGMDALLSSALGAIATLGTKYDIIHFHALGPALFSWLPKIASTAKVIVTCHGLDWRRSKWSKASSLLIRFGERAAVRWADRLIVVSQDLQAYFQKTYGKETIYIPNAPSSFEEPDPTFSFGTSLGLKPKHYIVFVGRLVPEKCPDLLISAFQTLEPSECKLALVGGSSDTREYTTKLINLAGHNPDVIFTGEVTGTHVAEILRQAKLFVLPSELEGLPLSLLEAMQAGVPILASNIPVHQQLIGTQRGLLFPVNNLETCARWLNWGLQHPQELAIMAKNAQEYVKANYNWNDITSQTLNIYEQVYLEPNKLINIPGQFSKESLHSRKNNA
ncbi:MAG TPA: glycoside hydrolase [Cyanobacteria bacterium UBA12227]|nr:glycoside hydrolase [Cyanobacteria bacterium UBA12227]HAX85115.1 glycoside hydrolase [Cyanobacteria bacterium UBA11370]HBY77724.1 glycoside hydrolase [Cyanobacteria bacterium UBA11148]